MKLDSIWHNRLIRFIKQGFRLSKDPSMTLETHGLILAVRNDSIPYDHNPNEFKIQAITGL